MQNPNDSTLGILAATVAGVSINTPKPEAVSLVGPVTAETTTVKPVSKRAKRAATPAKPAVTAKPDKPSKPAKPAAPAAVRFGPFTGGNLARTGATVAANRTSFGGVTSNRDEAYLALFATAARTASDKRTITLAALAVLGTNRFYSGSAKPHDAGAINRARKAGNVTVASDGASLVLTEAGASLAKRVLSKLSKPSSDKPAA